MPARHRPALADVVRGSRIGLIYLLLAGASVLLKDALGSTAYLWPADAVAIALLCRSPASPASSLLAIGLAAWLAHSGLGGVPPLLGGAVALVHLSADALAVWLLRDVLKIRGPQLTLESATIGFLVGGVLASGIGALLIGGVVAGFEVREPLPTMIDWWRAQVLMFAIVVPSMLLWTPAAMRKLIDPAHRLSNALGLLGCLFAGLLIFRYFTFPFVALIVPLLLIAYRTNPLATSLAGVALSIELIVCWLAGIRPPGTAPVEGDLLRSFPIVALALTVLPPITLALSVRERRAAVRALRESQEETKSIIEHSPIGIGVVRVGADTVDANPALLRMLGRNAQAGRSIELAALVHPDDLAANREMFESVRTGATPVGRGSFRYTRSDGSVLWVQSAMTLQRDANGEGSKWVVYAESLEERRTNEMRLLDERERFRTTLEAVSDAVLTTNDAGIVVYANSAAYRMLGQVPATALGQSAEGLLTLTREDGKAPAASMLRQALARADAASRSEPVALHRPDGSVLYVRDSAIPMRRDSGLISGWVIVLRDVTAAQHSEAEVRERADHDALTGLANRFPFERRLEELVRRNRHVELDAALLMIDLDRFKAVNDRGGHAAGDRMLKEVASVLTSVVRQGDLVCRLGGDEFAVILNACDLERARNIAARIVSTIEQRIVRSGNAAFSVAASVGIAPLPRHCVDASAWLAAADAACYHAKHEGGGRVVLRDGTSG